MDVVKRVHIVPLGYEFDRVLEPICDQRADLVYLLEHPTDDPDRVVPDYREELVSDIESAAATVRRRECDLTDVYAVLGEVTTLADEHATDSVSVNVSGGGTIAAIGATMACMDVSTDATAYYVEPEDYAHDPTTIPISNGTADVYGLPTYPIESPTRDQIAIMGFLADPASWNGYHEERTTPPKKKDCIEFARDVGLSFMADRAPPESHPGGEDKGAFRVLDTHVLDPLETDGYVEIEAVGRRRVITLTDQGENAYRAFRHKLKYAENYPGE
ncbi:DUF6293 family protein [Natronosalvus halobius]|uniref:HFX_2341 family transcriptional regulator domain-containing protein n=1 Tax=Natronosalvus halobius TaxID=2953746 RepID=UPI0020A0F61C|nr:DUF6293 family protein [Natronosalvus halobius]USZ73083.1 DUF6293 family protein [Natronosalvus halobius]